MWSSLSDAAKDLCRLYGWLELQPSPTWTELNPTIAAEDAVIREEQRIHLEMIPLYKSLYALALEFGLLHNGEPATWAMLTVVETLLQAARRPADKRVARWRHHIEIPQEYPALTESGWANAATGLPEEELFTIVIEIPPKQPNEGIKAFEKRFNNICRKARQEYLRHLRSEEWNAQLPYRDFTWIDRFAQWQAGRSAAEIVTITTPSDRAAFSRSIKATGEYIRITPRRSKHNPNRSPGH